MYCMDKARGHCRECKSRLAPVLGTLSDTRRIKNDRNRVLHKLAAPHQRARLRIMQLSVDLLDMRSSQPPERAFGVLNASSTSVRHPGRIHIVLCRSQVLVHLPAHVRMLVCAWKMIAILIMAEGLRPNGASRWCLSGVISQSTISNDVTLLTCSACKRCTRLRSSAFIRAYCDYCGELWISSVF